MLGIVKNISTTKVDAAWGEYGPNDYILAILRANMKVLSQPISWLKGEVEMPKTHAVMGVRWFQGLAEA